MGDTLRSQLDIALCSSVAPLLTGNAVIFAVNGERGWTLRLLFASSVVACIAMPFDDLCCLYAIDCSGINAVASLMARSLTASPFH